MVAMTASTSAIAKTALFTVTVPGTVVGLVPWWLRDDAQTAPGIQAWAATAVIIVGVAAYLHTAFWGFAATGRGTPAPIAPTKILVVRGLHRFVRNPMYIGVALIVAGQAWLFHSAAIAMYLAVLLIIFHLFVLFYEEPALKKQFGEEYARYRVRVPRWVPKFGP